VSHPRLIASFRPSSHLALALAAALTLAGCSSTISERGDLPDHTRLSEIKPGATTKEQVAQILGSPSSTGVFDDNSWYYISKKTKRTSFFTPKVLDQQVYVVNFNKNDVVASVTHRGLANARNIAPAPGETPSAGRKLSFIQQIIGNMGKFNNTDSSAQ
jgi:outer membrane protein assembly factor BamE (lipoprotein component of BamABCDE complex)